MSVNVLQLGEGFVLLGTISTTGLFIAEKSMPSFWIFLVGLTSIFVIQYIFQKARDKYPVRVGGGL